MMVNYDIATVKEFMFCTWPHIRMDSLNKFPPLNYHKTLNEKFPPLTCPVWIPAPPPPPHPWNYVQCMDYVMKWKIIETLPLHWSSLQWVSVLLHTDWQGWCIKVFFWKTRHECAMTKKGHILINLRQFEDQMPLVCKFKVWRVRKY